MSGNRGRGSEGYLVTEMGCGGWLVSNEEGVEHVWSQRKRTWRSCHRLRGGDGCLVTEEEEVTDVLSQRKRR